MLRVPGVAAVAVKRDAVARELGDLVVADYVAARLEEERPRAVRGTQPTVGNQIVGDVMPVVNVGVLRGGIARIVWRHTVGVHAMSGQVLHRVT